MTKVNPENMKELYDTLWNIFCKKNHDYGNSFELSLDKHGLVAGIVRMEDKMNRLSTLANGDKDAQIASESLVDTLMDLSNYAAMSACWLMHKDDDDVFARGFSGSTKVDPKDFKALSAIITGSLEDEENPHKLSSFEGHQSEDIVKEIDEQPLLTEPKGLENGYFIRQHKNEKHNVRYTLAFNPEGTVKTQLGEELPYVIECFGNDYDGMTGWAIHVFESREDMVAALNYDLKVRDIYESSMFGDSVGRLKINIMVFKPEVAKPVHDVWKYAFGPAFDRNMQSKDIFTEGDFGILNGIKTFGQVFISEKTDALVVKGVIRERFTDRNHNFIWFSDTKEVLLELKNTVPKFNNHGIIYGINSVHIKNGENYDFSPLYQDMEDKILSKFHSWDGSELKNLAFFNEDEELNSEFTEKKMQIPTDLVVEKPKNTVGTGEISIFSDMESGSLSSKNGKMELDLTGGKLFLGGLEQISGKN